MVVQAASAASPSVSTGTNGSDARRISSASATRASSRLRASISIGMARKYVLALWRYCQYAEPNCVAGLRSTTTCTAPEVALHPGDATGRAAEFQDRLAPSLRRVVKQHGN